MFLIMNFHRIALKIISSRLSIISDQDKILKLIFELGYGDQNKINQPSQRIHKDRILREFNEATRKIEDLDDQINKIEDLSPTEVENLESKLKENVARITGPEGMFRYYIKSDGTILFSADHCTDQSVCDKAQQFGFGIYGVTGGSSTSGPRNKISLTQPLQERPDYGTTSAYLHEKELVNEEILSNWRNTEDGLDLIQSIQNFQLESQKDKPVRLPYILKDIILFSNNVLNNIKSHN